MFKYNRIYFLMSPSQKLKKEQKKVIKSTLSILKDEDWDCLDEVDLFNLYELTTKKEDYYDEYYDEELKRVKDNLKIKVDKLKIKEK